MRKTDRIAISILVAAALLIGGITAPSRDAQAAGKKKVSINKNVKVTVGKTTKIKLKNNKTKVAWKIIKGKKLIKITKKSKKFVLVKGLKKGRAKVQAVVGKKKYTCTVKVLSVKKSMNNREPQPQDHVEPEVTVRPGVETTTVPVATEPVGSQKPEETTKPSENPNTPKEAGLYNVKPTAAIEGIPIKTWDELLSDGSIIVEDGVLTEADPRLYGHLVIGMGVTEIGDKAFYGCESLNSIVIPEGVTRIGKRAFWGCFYISIPNSVTSFGEDALSSSSWLEEKKDQDNFVIVNHVLISSGSECSGDIVIPDGVTAIADGAFSMCSDITSVKIPDSVTKIGDDAFFGCHNLTDVEMSNNVTDLGNHTFDRCYNLKEIAIPDGITTIGHFIFYDCTSLTSITIPKGVTSIGRLAFAGCTKLTNIEIPETVTDIDDQAFYACNISDIEIPKSVCHFGSHILGGTPWLREKQENEELIIINDILLYAGKKCSTDVVLPDHITAIAGYAFSGRMVESIVIPDSVTDIGAQAFERCEYLTKVTMPVRLNSMGNAMFWGCSRLQSVELPENIISIPYGTFSQCSNLRTLQISNTVTEIEDLAFWGCSSLINVEIPDNVESIGKQAFEECTDLTGIHIPDKVTDLDDRAFMGCSKLSDIDIPDSITSIGQEVFSNTEWLAIQKTNKEFVIVNGILLCPGEKMSKDIIIPNNVSSIAGKAFFECTDLISVTILDNVVAIGDSAFAGCVNLIRVVLSDQYKKIADELFQDCTNLTDITIPDGVTDIGMDAFRNCTGLSGVKVPDSVKRIGQDAFAHVPLVIYDGVLSYRIYDCGADQVKRSDGTIVFE